MKLIHIVDRDNTDRYINPMHVKTVKIVRSDYNQEWCIVLNLDGVNETKYTILCNSKENLNQKLKEVTEALESI